MKPAPFDYVRPASIDEACAALAADESVVIAGGQTLIPMMAMRLARPARLVDIARIPGLAGIREETDAVVIGATTRQVEAERSAMIARRVPLLARALPFVGHAPTRNRGTLGGSVANADPAAEIPLVLVTLGGSVVVRDGGKTQEIAAQDFALGPMMTALASGATRHGAAVPVLDQAAASVSDFMRSARGPAILPSRQPPHRSRLMPPAGASECAIGIGAATPRPVRLDDGRERC